MEKIFEVEILVIKTSKKSTILVQEDSFASVEKKCEEIYIKEGRIIKSIVLTAVKEESDRTDVPFTVIN